MRAAKRPAPPLGQCCGLDAAMNGGPFSRALAIVAAVVIASGLAAAQAASADVAPPTVIHGSASLGDGNGRSVVLRGTPPSPVPPAPASSAQATCPAGHVGVP